MKFVLHNPHIHWFKPMVGLLLNKKKSPSKYEFLFDYLYRKGIIYVHLDEFTISTIPYSAIKEFYLWILVNRLNPFKFRIVRDLTKLKGEDIFLICRKS